jgi:hypothetical protein
MAGDLFGGIFDNLRGYSSSIGDFFSRGNDTSPRTVGFSEEADLISNGWSGSSSGGGKSSSLLGAAADISKSLASSSRNYMPEVNLKDGMINTDGRVAAGRVGTLDAVDPGRFERDWIERLSKFARIEDLAKQAEGKPRV